MTTKTPHLTTELEIHLYITYIPLEYEKILEVQNEWKVDNQSNT